MKNRKKLIAILAGILAGVMVLSLILSLIPSVSAASSSEIRQQINSLKDEQDELRGMMEDLEGQYQENEDEIANIVAKKNVIDQEIFLLHAEISNINEQITAFNLLIADKQDELDAATALHDELSEKYKERIRTMEEEGSLSYWAVLFQASSFSDFLDRLNMIEEIAAADRRHLQEMNEAASAVSEAQEALETEKQDLEITKSELDAAYAELDDKRAEADELLAELLAKGDELESLYEEYQLMENDLLAEIAQKEQEYNNAKNQEWLEYMATYTTAPPETTVPPTTSPGTDGTEPTKEPDSTKATEPDSTTETEPSKDSNSGVTTDGSNAPACSASWLIPCSYTYVSSPFGNRDAPTAGASSNHQGIDLAAPAETEIYASRSGTVTAATYGSAAGYYVTINHGDGFSSIYMHMSRYVVSAGQRVSAGELIGYVGKTGVATGNHLHFGISYGGKYYNPALYVNFY